MSRWRGIETCRYGTRHMPVSTLSRLEAASLQLGRGVTQEMVLAMAVEYGLSTIMHQLLTLSRRNAIEEFMRDFDVLLREEEKGDEKTEYREEGEEEDSGEG